MMDKSDPGKSFTAPAGEKRKVIELGDLGMRIASDGTWFYRGSPIHRFPLVKLFASILRREENGEYLLITPAERGRVAVDDAPFLAVEMTAAGQGPEQRLIFRTNVDEIVTAGPRHPLRVETAASGAPAPYILVRDRLEAKLTRAVFFDLVELGCEEFLNGRRQFGVWSEGAFFPLGEIDDA